MKNVSIYELSPYIPAKYLPPLEAAGIKTTDELMENSLTLEGIPDIGPMRNKAIVNGFYDWYVATAREEYPEARLVIEAVGLKWYWKMRLHKYGIVTMEQAEVVAGLTRIRTQADLSMAQQGAVAAVRYASFSKISSMRPMQAMKTRYKLNDTITLDIDYTFHDSDLVDPAYVEIEDISFNGTSIDPTGLEWNGLDLVEFLGIELLKINTVDV